MKEKILSRLKTMLFGSIVLFLLFLLIGFLSGEPELFLIPLLAYFVLGLVLLVLLLKSSVSGKLRAFLLLSGLSSVGFSIGVLYGVVGIWGFYAINDPVYLITVMASTVGFIIGVAGSLVLFKNGGGRDASQRSIALDA